MNLADQWKDTKIPPVAGGLYDQPFRVVEACRYVWAVKRPYEMKSLGPLAALAQFIGM